ncbi:aggregation-promoting factor C-terminal-like domain-containing protein [Nocardioides stalactiti]|uniref:aggregation-promoting factor C-terminal-like domain-containing protein n=1 Tax=Nocardioides stalactiti TaxID=2755356 RepID=UPI0016009770|nr:lytic transglycosylase domain-containing protein [Nocardioides stalactiti]
MGGRRLVVGAALFAALLTGCGAPGEPKADPEAGPEARSSATPTKQPRDQKDRKERVSRSEGGARFEVPDAVIIEQLRRAAERIAQNYTAPPTPVPVDVDPGTNRALGYHLMLDFGFAEDQWRFLDALWHRESGWNHLADNPTSSAYGIPQSLPGSKMAVVGPDWRTNPETQIRWGLAYIAARYGTPERAWAHSEKVGWY